MLFLNQTNLEHITAEGKFVLEYDLALSLGIKPELVILIGLLEKVLIFISSHPNNKIDLVFDNTFAFLTYYTFF